MSICDATDGWGDLSPEDRFQQVSDWLTEWAQEWGMNPPNVVNADAQGEYASGPSGYDPATNTVYLGPDFFSDNSKYSAEDVAGEAAHELRHAMQWQFFGEDTPYEMPSHGRGEQDAQDFGDAVKDFATDECDDSDPLESPADATDGLAGGDWEVPAGDPYV